LSKNSEGGGLAKLLDESPFDLIVIQVTPNPNAMKYVFDRVITTAPASFFSAESARDHPLAKRLFAISGIAGVLILNEFITLNRDPRVPWKSISKSVRGVFKKT
jgi:hypothetical protein